VIVSEAELIASIARDSAAGKRIGFVQASFDLLRVDVVRLLQASAAESDRLVVAVIDTEGTPVVSVKDRAELVNGMRGVDYVIICGAGQVERLMALVAPHVP
jgi:bifunctional ADP-heptose synthase (sugar kinase/adenylyltransferase)